MSKLDYVPSKKTDGKYAILMETNGEECESWYYFIRITPTIRGYYNTT